jgi:hypothetical protein
LKIEPTTVEVDLDGMTPAEYVWSVNGVRRHLTPSQRAAVAVELSRTSTRHEGGYVRTRISGILAMVKASVEEIGP